ncbi:hypothetical protein P692DRAFT_20747660 [Suillus brevipes Sb2]|nr:hypothetical protein P692DRAFT_20747660 [Suillus brevipes Sb2]
MDRLIHERSINLGLALDRSTNQTYSSALNSYVTFCDLHHLSLDPTPDTLSLFVTYMSAHINPCSVDNYLSGISSVLEEYYPHVRQSRKSCLVSRTLKGAKRRFGVPIRRMLPLSRNDLANAQSALSSTLSHDDHLFLAILFDGFYGLLRLGELVWPNNRRLQSIDKVTLRTSVVVTPSYHSFVLPRHKSDSQFEGSTIVVQRAEAGGATSLAASGVPFDRIQAMGRWSSDAFCIYVRKNPALLHALVFNGRSIHDSGGPFGSI